MSIHEQVRLLAAGLSVNDTKDNLQCPSCGVFHEHKLSVTKVTGGVLYNCYRAKCGFKGFVPDYGAWEQRQEPQIPVNRPYRGRLLPLSDDDVQFFHDAWQIDANAFGIRVTEDARYAFPLLSKDGDRRGWVLRVPRWSSLDIPVPLTYAGDAPKAVTRKNVADDSNLSWPTRPSANSVVVVTEDYLSACKVSLSGAFGVSAQGTHLTYHSVKELKMANPELVVFWFDPGAENQAYALQRQWGLTFNYSCVITGDKDPKDYSVEEIREKLSGIGW